MGHCLRAGNPDRLAVGLPISVVPIRFSVDIHRRGQLKERARGLLARPADRTRFGPTNPLVVFRVSFVPYPARSEYLRSFTPVQPFLPTIPPTETSTIITVYKSGRTWAGPIVR